VIEAGASENAFDLGGLPLTGLDLRAGAGKYDLDFSSPNPAEMRTCELAAGAGAVTARRLAHANFAYLQLGGGVPGCTLDFSGELRRDACVDAGLAAVEIVVPRRPRHCPLEGVCGEHRRHRSGHPQGRRLLHAARRRGKAPAALDRGQHGAGAAHDPRDVA
jgi:hypothetical protein